MCGYTKIFKDYFLKINLRKKIYIMQMLQFDFKLIKGSPPLRPMLANIHCDTDLIGFENTAVD